MSVFIDEQEASLLARMADPDFYPHKPARVERRQTHISYIFLAGDFVYKIKKPLWFPFLDYTTLERRKLFCEEEVRLNRRLAPELYLGVEAIHRGGRRFHFGPPGEVVEYAVKMRRLKKDCMLDSLVKRHAVTFPMIEALAEHLAAFHFRQENSVVPLEVGTPEQIRNMVRANSREIRSACAQAMELWLERGIGNFMELFSASHEHLFLKRLHDGRVRDGHGDLRCEHVCLGNAIVIYDCIEFDATLRSGDVASEVAFLAMDLDARHAPELGERLAQRYAQVTNDPELLALLPFYKIYRASVRGKVEWLKSTETDVLERERADARVRAKDLFRLAYGYTWKAIQPCLVLFSGLPGTGKSTLAKTIADRSGFPLISSDRIRKELAGIGPAERRRVAVGEDIYSEAWTKRTYGRMLDVAHSFLKQGRGVLLDATFLKEAYRWPFARMAKDLGLPILFIHLVAPDRMVRERMERRERENRDPSDATWDVYLAMKGVFEPLVEIDERDRVTFEADRLTDALLSEIESIIKRAFVERGQLALLKAECH